MHHLFRLVFAITCLTSLCCCQKPPSEKTSLPTYRIGYMVCNSEEETLDRFKPLTAYLSLKIGVNFEAVAIDTINFTKEVENLDFTHTNSLLYIMMNRFHGVQLLAGEKAGSLGTKSQGGIAVLNRSSIKQLEDLKGKTMLFGPMYAPTSYLTQLDLLLQGGLDPDDDLAYYSFTQGSFKHEKVIYGVYFGKADAGAFPLLDLERMIEAGKIEPDAFRIIATGNPIPYCTFASTQRVDDSLAQTVQKVLLAITPEDTVAIDGEVVNVLGRALVDGYTLVEDSAYEPIRTMAQRTNMPPYQKY